MSKTLKAAIFDMDGLMIDSEGDQSLAFEKVLKQHGIEPTFNKSGVIQVVGVRAIDNWHRLRDEHNIEASAEELLAQKNEIYEAIIKEGVRQQPGLKQLVVELHERGVKLAIASSSQKKDIIVVLKHLDLAEYFDVVISGTEVKHGKPAPDVYIEASRQLGVSPANCIALEDAKEGILSAKAAGITAIAVPNQYTHDHDFDTADLVVASLNELNWKTISGLL